MIEIMSGESERNIEDYEKAIMCGRFLSNLPVEMEKRLWYGRG